MEDDMENYQRKFEIAPTSRVFDLLSEALKVCPLADVGRQATWSVFIVDQDRKPKRSIGVISRQWSQPKLAISPDETVESLFADGAASLFFFYEGQSDPEAVFQALMNARPAPPPFVATETIKVDGQDTPVREIKTMLEWHARLLVAADGSTYLSYPVSVGQFKTAVSVGQFKTEIAAFQKLSPEALAADEAGKLDLGKLSHQLSEYAQDHRTYNGSEMSVAADRSARKTFPEGSPVVSAWLENEMIFVLFANGFQTEVDPNTITTILASANPPTLSIRHECSWEVSLPLSTPGAEGILQYFRQLPGFSESTFQATLTRGDPGRFIVLSRPLQVNARLHAEPDEEESRRVFLRDLDLGLRLVASDEHIPWDMTMHAALAQFGLGRGGYSDGWICIGPVRLGALEIDKCEASGGIYRSDIPLKYWSTPLLLINDGGKANAELVNAFLRRQLGEPDNNKFHPFQSETETNWSRCGISITVTYKEPTSRAPQTGPCRFELRNDRSYPELLTDAYCASVRPSDVKSMLFSVPEIKLPGWYARSRYVRATPPGLLGLFSDSGNFLVWVDYDGIHAGFADRSFAAVFPRAAIACIELQNSTADRGGGRFGDLYIEIAGQTRREEAGASNYGEFDSILEEIGKLLERPVKKLPDLVGV